MASAVIGALRVNLAIDTAEFNEGIKRAQQNMQRIGRSMQTVGRNMSTYVTAPLAGFGALTLKVAGDFEASMNKVAAVSGATGDQLEGLKRLAMDMGATTQFSASQAADAMSFLAMAGFSVQETMDALPGTLQLAASAQMDLGRAADIVSNVLSGYGMEVSELGRVNDVLVKAFTASNTNLEQLGEAMKYAGPVASAAGADFEEVAAALGMMGNAGIQASMAGTSLRGAISRILAPTKAMRGAMEEAGLSFTDAGGKLLPLADIIQQLEPHADNAGLFMELFGQRAGPAMAALVSQGSDALRELTTELDNSAGTADRIGAVQMEGFNGAMRELTSAFEGLQLAIATSGLLEFFTGMVNGLSGIIQNLSQTNPALLKWGTILAGVAAILGPLVLTIGLLVTAAAAISAPVLAAGAAIGATVAGMTALYYGLQAAMPYLQEFAGSVWETIKQKLAEAREAFMRFVDDPIAALRALPSQMMQIGSDIIAGLLGGLQAKWQSVKAWFSGLGDSIPQWVRDKLGIRSPSRVMAEIGGHVMTGLGQGIEEGGKSVESVASNIASTVSNAFQGLIDGSKKVKDVIKDLLGQLGQMWINQGFQALLGGGMGKGGGGGGIFGSIARGLGGLLGFKDGGSFQVGGAGGVDSQLVAFKASPNERVTITKPGQEASGGRGVVISQTFQLSGAVSSDDVQNMVRQGAGQAVQVVKDSLPGWQFDIQTYGRPA